MERKFKRSKINKNYRLPKEAFVVDRNTLDDSESSIGSLEGVTYYDLRVQNQKNVLDKTERLVELLLELGSMEYQELYLHLE